MSIFAQEACSTISSLASPQQETCRHSKAKKASKTSSLKATAKSKNVKESCDAKVLVKKKTGKRKASKEENEENVGRVGVEKASGKKRGRGRPPLSDISGNVNKKARKEKKSHMLSKTKRKKQEFEEMEKRESDVGDGLKLDLLIQCVEQKMASMQQEHPDQPTLKREGNVLGQGVPLSDYKTAAKGMAKDVGWVNYIESLGKGGKKEDDETKMEESEEYLKSKERKVKKNHRAKKRIPNGERAIDEDGDAIMAAKRSFHGYVGSEIKDEEMEGYSARDENLESDFHNQDNVSNRSEERCQYYVHLWLFEYDACLHLIDGRAPTIVLQRIPHMVQLLRAAINDSTSSTRSEQGGSESGQDAERKWHSFHAAVYYVGKSLV